MITFRQTCWACPERYDAFDGDRRVGYRRLRHASFTVECPHVGGDLVYEASALGDGRFEVVVMDNFLSYEKAIEVEDRTEKAAPICDAILAVIMELANGDMGAARDALGTAAGMLFYNFPPHDEEVTLKEWLLAVECLAIEGV